LQTITYQELENRWKRLRNLLNLHIPRAEGIFIFSRINLYYFTGTYTNGVLWIPLTGEPVIFCRKGIERAKLESPLKNIFSFNSYSDIESTLNSINITLPKAITVEMNGLSWSLSNSFKKYLSKYEFISGDKIIAMTRSKKSEMELKIMRETGKKHAKCLTELLPPLLHKHINELEISHIISGLFLSEGHHGILRMANYGEEIYLGHISIGDSANYSSVFNGPVGLRGAHPVVPFMGSEEITWNEGQPLTIDNGFNLEGYHTDKTQIYWLGQEKDIPENVKKAHDFCINTQKFISDNLKPGNIPSEIWKNCLERAQKNGFSEGFMGLGGNKVPFAGHGIGLYIDEYPVIATGFDLPFEVGMTMAVEPKIGIPGIGMVGVENTFEITKDGGKSLTGDKYDIVCIT